jgi:uncharacterized Zn finger protein (UPF0148 family)
MGVIVINKYCPRCGYPEMEKCPECDGLKCPYCGYHEREDKPIARWYPEENKYMPEYYKVKNEKETT